MSGEINIESDKILLYCRFCLQIQSNNAEEMSLSQKFQQEFFELTQKKVRHKICNICSIINFLLILASTCKLS